MTAADQRSRLGPYVTRLLEDEYIQDQLGQAITGLRRSSRRAKGRSTSEAIKDRRLRNQFQDAVNSLLQASSALQGKPAKRKRRLLPALLLAAAGTAAVVARQAKSKRNKPTPEGGQDG